MTDKNDAQTPLEDVLTPKEGEETPRGNPGARKVFQEREQLAQEQGKLDLEKIKEEKTRDEAGKFTKEKTNEEEKKQEAKPDAKILEEFDRKYKASIAQANAERSKRQELERRLLELEKKPKEPEKPFWDAPEEALNRIKQEIQQSTEGIKSEFRNELVKNRLNTSEQIARGKYKDFDQAIETFSQMVTENPALGSAWLQSPDPAEFAYKQGRTHQQLQEVGDVDKLREKIEKEVRVKLEAELKDKEEKLKAEREALPGSLSDARGTSQNKFVWTGPTPLGEILKH